MESAVAIFAAELDYPQADLKHLLHKLNGLKQDLTQLSSFPPSTWVEQSQLAIIRDVYELGVFLSIKLQDMALLERHMDFLKILYFDYQSYLQPTDRTWLLLSLQLIYLLSFNKITNFHTELERIPYDQRSNSYITFAVTLEQGFMEGDYNKVLQCKNSSPSPIYEFFINRILDTIRNEIARSAEKAYNSLSLESACQILMIGTIPELQHFVDAFVASKENDEIEWRVIQDRIYFIRKEDARVAEIPKWQLLTQAINYAIELERIV